MPTMSHSSVRTTEAKETSGRLTLTGYQWHLELLQQTLQLMLDFNSTTKPFIVQEILFAPLGILLILI